MLTCYDYGNVRESLRQNNICVNRIEVDAEYISNTRLLGADVDDSLIRMK